LLLAAAFALPAVSQTPDFGGIWTSATLTPLERPVGLKDKPFFTPAEASEFERQEAARNEDLSPTPSVNVGTYNTAFREFGAHVVKTLRTSIITDPPDGRLPALTPAAATAKRQRTQRLRSPASALDLGLQDQCLIFPTAVPPMIPYSYNSNYQIIQTKDQVMLQVEMIHETRVIRLNGSLHLPQNVRLWLGDSIGHWEGKTLVVDTTNFNDGDGFYGDAGGMFGWDRDLHVTERFSFLDPKTILYRFEVEDPTAFTKSWKGELTMERAPGSIYEYACHEGNYALPNLMNAYRSAR
jgi:hypothetical protein